MFDFHSFILKFKEHPGYNDTNFPIIRKENPNWMVLGLHRLNDEIPGGPYVYVEALCKQNERAGFQAIHWTWKGKRPDELAPPIFAGSKPHNELVHLSIPSGMEIDIWMLGSEGVRGLVSEGKFSYFVCFQELDEGNVPLPVPEPEPKLILGTVNMKINKSMLNDFPVDVDGNISFSADMILKAPRT